MNTEQLIELGLPQLKKKKKNGGGGEIVGKLNQTGIYTFLYIYEHLLMKY
jgi:hypothetical protein